MKALDFYLLNLEYKTESMFVRVYSLNYRICKYLVYKGFSCHLIRNANQGMGDIHVHSHIMVGAISAWRRSNGKSGLLGVDILMT